MCFNDNHIVSPQHVYAIASVRPTLSGPGAGHTALTSSLANIELISTPHCTVGPGSVNIIRMKRY